MFDKIEQSLRRFYMAIGRGPETLERIASTYPAICVTIAIIGFLALLFSSWFTRGR